MIASILTDPTTPMIDGTAAQNEPVSAHGALLAAYGVVPDLFLLQSDLPRVIDAEQRLVGAILLRESALGGQNKDAILGKVADIRENAFCRPLYPHDPAAPSLDSSLLRFVLKLASSPWISREDVAELKSANFDDGQILDTILTVALGHLLCTLADAFHADLNSPLAPVEAKETPAGSDFSEWAETPGPYLGVTASVSSDFQPFAFLREQFGFVPNVFKQQMLRPKVVQAEVEALERILLPEDTLSRIQKESIALVVSATNANTYFVAVHAQILSTLGVPFEESDQIIQDYREANLLPADVALLDQVRHLASYGVFGKGRFEQPLLQAQGLTKLQIIEAVAMAAFTNFLNTVQAGLGAVSDFPPRRTFTPKDLYPSPAPSRPIYEAFNDSDAALVARVQNGDTDPFEDLVRRHTRRVFGILVGLVGNMDDARDASQDVFLKAFENIGRFQGRSKFSTWLTSIAINTGTELLRQRKPSEAFDELEDEEGFRPRQVQSWAEDPEQLVTASERDDLVRKGVLRLPQKYRVAVLLRDVNQLSTDEAALTLGLSVPALKARVLRGRMMLRETLAPHFVRGEKGTPDA